MAERYGTIPKKFTHEWWEYFWMYYKVYVIIAVFVIITASVTIYQNLTAPEYDLAITYAGNSAFSAEMCDEVVATLSPVCEDVDKNKEKSLNFNQLNFNTNDMTYNASMSSKMMLSLSEEDVYIYILDSMVADAYIPSKDDSNFIPVKDWFKGDISQMGKYEKDGVVYGIELTDCKEFQEIAKKTDADFSGNYLFVRYYPRPDQVKKQADGHKAAMKLAAKIVQGK